MLQRYAALMFATWECPHCDHQHRITLDISEHKDRSPHIVTCETEDDGCGKDVAIYPQIGLTILSAKIML